MNLHLDTSKEKLGMFFKDWQIESLRYLWKIRPEGAKSKAVWINVNKGLKGSISRASIINFLNYIVEEDLLGYVEATGKGGYHRVYYMKYDRREFVTSIVDLIISKLLREFPEAIRKALLNLDIQLSPL